MISDSNEPTLSYATDDADGAPDYLPEAEQKIDAGAKPSAIAKHFRNAKQAGRYYAKSQARRHWIDNLAHRCCMCGEPNIATACSVFWDVKVTKFLSFRFGRGGESTTTFFTAHSICETCYNHLETSARRIGNWRIVLGWTSLIVWLVVVGGYVLYRTLRGTVFVPYILLSIALAAGCIAPAVERMIRRTLPDYFERIMPRGVRFLGIGEPFDRKEPTEEFAGDGIVRDEE